MPKRMIDTELWNDIKVVEDFTAEDTYFWLYLLTSPHNTISGLIKCSPKTIAYEMKYSTDCIKNLLQRFDKLHKLIKYNEDNGEILILHWYKYNWSNSPKIAICVRENLKKIKTQEFANYILETLNNILIVNDKKT